MVFGTHPFPLCCCYYCCYFMVGLTHTQTTRCLLLHPFWVGRDNWVLCYACMLWSVLLFFVCSPIPICLHLVIISFYYTSNQSSLFFILSFALQRFPSTPIQLLFFRIISFYLSLLIYSYSFFLLL